MKKIIPAITIPIIAAVIGSGVYLAFNNPELLYVLNSEIVEASEGGVEESFVKFKAVEMNPETGQFNIADVLEQLDEWIQKDKETKEIYKEYKKMEKKDRLDILIATSTIAYNTKLKEIRDNCLQDKRCVKVKVK